MNSELAHLVSCISGILLPSRTFWSTSSWIPASIAAGLLHDVPENTKVGIEEIRRQFGDEIAGIVDGVTKLTAIEAQTKEEAQAGTYRKMFIAMADDPRVVLVKLADRLHNMRTLDSVPPDKQKRVARETLEIYAPLAHRLGIWQIKWELEDQGVRDASTPKNIRRSAASWMLRRDVREKIVQRVIDAAAPRARQRGHQGRYHRPAQAYLFDLPQDGAQRRHALDQIYDQLAVRVIVEVGRRVLPVCSASSHTIWPPVPGEFDDYIAMPKESMYRSLHTTVLIPGGQPCEIQIRTHEMHEVAEHGIAAHWRYKEGFGRATPRSRPS